MAMLDYFRAAVAALVILTSLPVLGETEDALLADGWSEVLFDGKTPNRFEAHGESGIGVISDRSVSLLQKQVSVNLRENPVLTWRWRVTTAAPPTDLGVKGGDDRSLALYVAFPFVPEEASVMERMKRAVVEKTIGTDAPGRVLNYIWGGNRARGDRMPNPYLGDTGLMTILRSADTPTGPWFSETIDIAEDYRQAFGSEPPDPISIAIGADSDDTMSTVQGTVSDLVFKAQSKAF